MTTEIIDFGEGVVLEIDPDSGEVLTDVRPGSPMLHAVAVRRHYAKAEEKEWARACAVLDQVLLRSQDETVAAYGDVSIRTVRDRSYPSQDAEAFANMLYERYASAFAHTPEAQDAVGAVMTVLAASKGFKRDALPEAAQALLDRVTEWKPMKQWVESSIVRTAAPRRQKAVTEAIS